MSVQCNRSRIARWIVAMVIAIVALGSMTRIADATLITNYWTSWQGYGFIAYTAASRAVTLEIDSDVSVGGSYYNIGYGVTSLEINQHVNCSGGTVTVSSQHSAYDPSTAESDWQASEGSGSCGP